MTPFIAETHLEAGTPSTRSPVWLCAKRFCLLLGVSRGKSRKRSTLDFQSKNQGMVEHSSTGDCRRAVGNVFRDPSVEASPTHSTLEQMPLHLLFVVVSMTVPSMRQYTSRRLIAFVQALEALSLPPHSLKVRQQHFDRGRESIQSWRHHLKGRRNDASMRMTFSVPFHSFSPSTWYLFDWLLLVSVSLRIRPYYVFLGVLRCRHRLGWFACLLALQ